jgi:hypothetical protein
VEDDVLDRVQAAFHGLRIVPALPLKESPAFEAMVKWQNSDDFLSE